MTPASPWSQTGTWELIMPPGVSSPAQSRLVSLRLPFEMFLLSFSSHFTCDHPLGVIHFVHIIRWCMKNKYLITHFVVICLGTEMSLQSLLGLKSGIEVVECLSAICNFPIHFHFPPKKKRQAGTRYWQCDLKAASFHYVAAWRDCSTSRH